MGNRLKDLVLVSTCTQRSHASAKSGFPSRGGAASYAYCGEGPFCGGDPRLACGRDHARNLDSWSSFTSRCPHNTKRGESSSSFFAPDNGQRKTRDPRLFGEQRIIFFGSLSGPRRTRGLSKGSLRPRPARGHQSRHRTGFACGTVLRQNQPAMCVPSGLMRWGITKNERRWLFCPDLTLAVCVASLIPPAMESVRLLDTREGLALEQAAESLLDSVRPVLLRIVQQSKRLEDPVPDSWLGRVDSRTRPFETSQLARTFALVAADNLQQVELTLRKSLPPFALYSMIRSAIEASSLGLWILDARDEQEAASRTLRIYRQNIASDRTMWSTLVAGPSASHDDLHAEAESRHTALRGSSQGAFEKAVLSSAVIRVVDLKHRVEDEDRPPLSPVSGLEAWRMCSSIVHANPVSMLHLLERHPDGNIGDSATRTSRLSFVASFYVTACNRAESLITAFRSRSRSRRTSR